MFSSGVCRRAVPQLRSCIRAGNRSISTKSSNEASKFHWTYAVVALGAGTATYWALKTTRHYTSIPLEAEAPQLDQSLFSIQGQPFLEAPRPKAATKEENRDIISSQHAQTKRSWENPGVYAWGMNADRVVAPDSEERWIKYPRRIPFFDGILLRDIKLDKTFGVAINENGDLLQ